MKRRILSSIFLLATISLIVVSVALCAVFYLQLSSSVQREVRERAAILKDTITVQNADELVLSDMRLTIVADDGKVLYDDDRLAAQLPNHADREEIKEALTSGIGESRRYSDTLGQETYYYAVKISDGSLLRLAKTTSSMWGMFRGAIPIVLAVMLMLSAISYALAGRLTKRIVDPINNVQINEDLVSPYDELAPLIRTISQQRVRISQQITDLKNRSDTIVAIMDRMSEGVILVDNQGAILSINKSAEDIFPIRESANGKNILEILRNVELNEAMRSALEGTRNEINLTHADRTFRVYFSPVPGSGAVILFLDITDKVHTEQLRREFSANVSHELKTPLTTIYGNAEMLGNGMVKEMDKPNFYAKIKGEAERLITLIEDIIMLSRLDENNGEMLIEQVDLLDVADEVVVSLMPKAKEQNITMTITGSGVFPANRAQMVELFHNLIDNAIKYNKPNGTVTVALDVTNNQAKFVITDTGIGIPKEELSRIFERFYRVDKSRSKKTGGTGLGLAIVKHIVIAYDGKIELHSAEGQGTNITVWLNTMRQ